MKLVPDEDCPEDRQPSIGEPQYQVAPHGEGSRAPQHDRRVSDGLILAASLVLLHEARNGRDAPGLAWPG